MNRALLLKAADVLETLPKQFEGTCDRFDFAVWAKHKEGCGTTACAAGWLAFKMGSELGLQADVDHNDVKLLSRRWVTGSAALACAFGIPEPDARKLFIDPYLELYGPMMNKAKLKRVTPRMVAEAIRDYVANGFKS